MPTPTNALLGIVLVAGVPASPTAAEAQDPLLCPVLASLSPGVPGVVDINAEGDVSLAGVPFWDCPPYG